MVVVDPGHSFALATWIISLVGAIALLVGVVVLLVLLVRFLLVGTRAAQLYLERNAPVAARPTDPAPFVETEPAPDAPRPAARSTRTTAPRATTSRPAGARRSGTTPPEPPAPAS